MDTMLNWLWQGGVVAIAWGVMLLALTRARANVRYLVCWAAALLVLVLPVLVRLWPATASSAAVQAMESDAIVSLPAAWWTSSTVMLAAWTAWIGWHAVRLVSAIAAIRAARARSRAFPSQVEAVLPHWSRLRSQGRRATLMVSDSVTTAAVLGWGPPVIAVAPPVVEMLDTDELDRILIHEWAHVQRRDDAVNLLQIAVRMIAGWHPAIWWIDRRLHVEREIACDEMTVAIAGSPKSYAASLLKLTTIRGGSRVMHAAPAVVTSSSLRARVVKIVSPRKAIAPVWSCSLAAAIVTTLGVIAFAVGALRFVDVTAFAQPFVPSRAPSATIESAMPAAMSTSVSSGATRRSSPRPMGPTPPVQRPTPEPSLPAPPPRSEPEARTTPDAASAAVTTSSAERAAEPDHVSAALLPSTPLSVPNRLDAPAEPSPSPWKAVAAGGATVGRKSKDAGVATAGFFTRFARRVAGSF